jgi:hypothetical protein
MHPDEFWHTVLNFPIQLDGAQRTLAFLLSSFMDKGSYSVALKRYGIECTGFSQEQPQFTFDWSKNTRLDVWLTDQGFATGLRPNQTKFRVVPVNSQ